VRGGVVALNRLIAARHEHGYHGPMLMLEWVLVLLLAAVVLTNLAERLAVPYPSLLAIAGAGLAFLPRLAPPSSNQFQA
jgi:hypothetical protein